ncbi:hypothetical protein KAU87_00035, partial [Candidatus Bathyarchaeota archaeon]|nr:hypothetical protein [Candidatus Bathyarchaeota archaeon]
ELEVEAADPRSLQQELSQLEGTVKIASPSSNMFKAYVSMAESWVPRMTDMCYRKKARILSIRVTEPSLDDVFLHFTGRALGETPDA